MLDTVAGESPLARARSALVIGPRERSSSRIRRRLAARSSLGEVGSKRVMTLTLPAGPADREHHWVFGS